MKDGHCDFEEKIAEASRTGEWSEAMLAHVASCRSCEEIALVASYVGETSDARGCGENPPDAGRIWWKAQMAAKAEAMERALRPIVWARRFAFGAGAAMVLVALAILAPQMNGFWGRLMGAWTDRRAAASAAEPNQFVAAAIMGILIVFLPLIFGLYAVWSED